MRWGEEQTYQFVKIYLKYANLWDSKHEIAKNSKIESYREMISEFNEATGIELNIVELKIKIRNLKSTYKQEVAKIKRRSSPECMFKSSLKWFALWHKHFAKTVKEEVNGSYDDEQDPIEDASQVWVTQSKNLSISIDHIDDSEDLINLPKDEPIEAYDHLNPSHGKVKKKKIQLRSSSAEFSDRTFRGSMDSSDFAKEDEFEIYGKYIASQLRRMELQKALRLQLEIQSLVSEARISDLTNKH